MQMSRNTVFTSFLAVFCLVLQAHAQNASPTTVLDPGFGFSFIGCYNEYQNNRSLPDAQLVGTQQNMTVELCAQFCSTYTFMGVEYGTECYCGNSVLSTSREVTTESGLSCSDPRFACEGDPTEMCGGYLAYDLYAKAGATTTAAVPSHTGYVYVMDSFIVESASSPGGTYNYIGCYKDPGQFTRALNGNVTNYGATNIEACANFCTGYKYFGEENGGECYCGNTIDNGAAVVPCQDECYQCCASDISERCGGYYRLSMYELDASAFVPPSQTVCTYNGPATAMVMGSSTYTYYGPITTGSTAIPVVTTDSAGHTTSYTSTAWYCDGGNCQPNQHTPGGTITGMHYPSSTPTPSNKPTIDGCSWLGCYDDNGGPRALAYFQTQLDTSAMTVELCVSACLTGGYAYAGMEYGSQCFCGPEIIAPHAPVVPGAGDPSGTDLTCSNPQFACTGDTTEQCGGFATIGIYYCPQNAPPNSTMSASQPTHLSTATIGMSSMLGDSSMTSASMGMSSMLGESSMVSASMGMSSMLGGSAIASACTRRTAVIPITV